MTDFIMFQKLCPSFSNIRAVFLLACIACWMEQMFTIPEGMANSPVLQGGTPLPAFEN